MTKVSNPIRTFGGHRSNVRLESISLENSVAAEIGGGEGRSLCLGPEASLPIRLRGPVIEMDRKICQADFLARPIGSRAGALLARQKDVLMSAAALDAGLAEQRRRIEADPSIVSSTWAVYAVQPDEAEFWQADEERKHTRLQYRLANHGGWTLERLWP